MSLTALGNYCFGNFPIHQDDLFLFFLIKSNIDISSQKMNVILLTQNRINDSKSFGFFQFTLLYFNYFLFLCIVKRGHINLLTNSRLSIRHLADILERRCADVLSAINRIQQILNHSHDKAVAGRSWVVLYCGVPRHPSIYTLLRGLRHCLFSNGRRCQSLG